MTIGGTNGPICNSNDVFTQIVHRSYSDVESRYLGHDAGRGNRSLSDLVRKLEYIDANGEREVVERTEHLRAVNGCFGLMGVITHLTLEFAL